MIATRSFEVVCYQPLVGGPPLLETTPDDCATDLPISRLRPRTSTPMVELVRRYVFHTGRAADFATVSVEYSGTDAIAEAKHAIDRVLSRRDDVAEEGRP